MSIKALFVLLFTVIVALAVLLALAIGGLIAQMPSGAQATAAYGAEQFHLQLTAQAEQP